MQPVLLLCYKLHYVIHNMSFFLLDERFPIISLLLTALLLGAGLRRRASHNLHLPSDENILSTRMRD